MTLAEIDVCVTSYSAARAEAVAVGDSELVKELESLLVSLIDKRADLSTVPQE